MISETSAALIMVQAGSYNTAIGWGAGGSLTSGSDNIYLSHPGAASESRTMRLGTPTVQTRTFIAGVVGRPVSGSQVMINSSGQLGVLASSSRYKQDIADMRERSVDIYKLRPVTFHYKDEPTGPLQYGLIAEEVAKVYRELVTWDANGTIEGVRYEELTPMLLNELQRHQQQLDAQSQQLHAFSQQLAELKAQHESLRAAVAVLQEQPTKTLATVETPGVQELSWERGQLDTASEILPVPPLIKEGT